MHYVGQNPVDVVLEVSDRTLRRRLEELDVSLRSAGSEEGRRKILRYRKSLGGEIDWMF